MIDVLLLLFVVWLSRGLFFTVFAQRRRRHVWGELQSSDVLTIMRRTK